MNYKILQEKNKKKNVAITVLSIVLVVAMLLSFVAVVSRGFTKAPDLWTKKDVPTSTFVLGLRSVDELVGVKFTEETFSFVGTDVDFYDKEYAWSIINLSVEDFGEEFTAPEEGKYKISYRLNGNYYTSESLGDDAKDSWYFGIYEQTDAVGFISLSKYAYLKADGAMFLDYEFNGEITHIGDNVVVPGHSLQIYYYCESNEITDFELISFEKVD